MPVLLGDIATGKTAGADVCFLIAMILFILAAILALFRNGPAGEPAGRPGVYWPGLHSLLMAAGLALVAFGLLLQ